MVRFLNKLKTQPEVSLLLKEKLRISFSKSYDDEYSL